MEKLKSRVNRRGPLNLQDLKTVCVEEWAKITPEQCMRLVSPTGGVLKLSLPTRLLYEVLNTFQYVINTFSLGHSIYYTQLHFWTYLFFFSLLLGLLPTSGLHSAPKKRCKTFIKRKRWCVDTPVWWRQCCTMAAEKAILWSFWRISELVEIGINTCLILQIRSMLQSLPLPSRIKKHPIEWIRDLWKLWFLIIVIQYLPRI